MENLVTVELESAVGPRVIVTGEVDAAEVEAALPVGWTVGDNWHNGVKLADGSHSYPLVQLWNVYRTVGDDETDQELVGSAPTLEEARRLARPGDQIQHGADGAVENV